jgi:type III secretion protein Q
MNGPPFMPMEPTPDEPMREPQRSRFTAVTELADSPLLPRLATPAALAATRAYAWPHAFRFDIDGVAYALRWDYTAQLAPGVPRRYRFRFGPAAGWLVLEARAEQALIGDGADDAVPDAIRCALLADTLSPVFDTLEHTSRQQVTLIAPEPGDTRPDESWHTAHALHDASASPPPESGHTGTHSADGSQAGHSPLRFVAKRLNSGWQTHGELHFDDPRYLTLACPAEPALPVLAPHDFDALPVPLSFSIGATRFTQQELTSVQHGDIIAIEQWKSAGSGIVCSATTRGKRRLVLSGRVLGAQITIDQIQPTEEPDVNAPNPNSAAPPEDSGSSTPADKSDGLTLDALEVTTTFELERRTVTLAQLKAMQPGFVIELEQPLNQSVIRILANGLPIGIGHLIAVGNKLGIRVSELTPGTPSNTTGRKPVRNDG